MYREGTSKPAGCTDDVLLTGWLDHFHVERIMCNPVPICGSAR